MKNPLKQRLLKYSENKRIELENRGHDFSMENPFNDYEEKTQVHEVIGERVYFMDGEVVHFNDFKTEEMERLVDFIETNNLKGKKI